ncbi:MAG TPA: kinase/pyrophosphorylase, partial [Thermomonas sp.]|nr:kinase/pyrophosphorylase [Thermomonas sp.]
MDAARPVYFVSDGTGITAETIGHSLLTQFDGVQFATDRLPFVDTAAKAREAASRIRAAGAASGMRPIVVNSCVDGELTALLAESGALMLDVFAPFIAPLERELGQSRQARVGQAHGIVDFESYHRR